MAKKFGHWEVTEDFIQCDKEKRGEHFIAKRSLLELRLGNDQFYKWLIHIPPKTWLTTEDVYNLNDALKNKNRCLKH